MDLSLSLSQRRRSPARDVNEARISGRRMRRRRRSAYTLSKRNCGNKDRLFRRLSSALLRLLPFTQIIPASTALHRRHRCIFVVVIVAVVVVRSYAAS